MEFIKKLLRSQSKDPVIASRERIIRPFSLIIFVGAILSFISTFVVFHNTWTLISTPTVIFIITLLTAINLGLVYSGKIDIAAWFIVIIVLLGLLGMLYNDGYNYYAAPYIFCMVILLVAILLPRKFIFPITILGIIIMFFIANVQFSINTNQIVDPIGNLVRNLTSLLVAYLASILAERK